MVLQREPTEEQKRQVLEIHGRKCFVTGHPIGENDPLEFDHIRPVDAGGPTSVDNLAPVCKTHNRQKLALSLSEYRDKLLLDELFQDSEPKYLDQLLSAKGKKLGQSLQYEIQDNEGRISVFFGGSRKEFTLYQCPVTHWNFFYAMVPVEYLKNDRELQPRPLRKKELFELYKHFRRNTQLAPSICRLVSPGSLLLFDGQHKAAAQIWAGRPAVECKVYLDPNASRLKATNLEAHESYRQMKFYSGELMAKYAGLFKEDWEDFLTTPGVKSEAAFVDFLMARRQLSKAKAKAEVENAIHNRILTDSDNLMLKFVSSKNRTRNQPLTHNQLKVTLFKHLIRDVPTAVEFESDKDFRETEQRNLITLMSIIAEEVLIEKWDPEIRCRTSEG